MGPDRFRLARRIPGHKDYMIGGVRYVPLADLKRAEERNIDKGHALFAIRTACLYRDANDVLLDHIYKTAVWALGRESSR